MGGLSRRASIVEQQKDLGPTVIVDAGDLYWKSASLPVSRRAQQRVKARLQMEAYALSGIDAMVPGDADLALGLDWLIGSVSEFELPYVAANLACEGWDIPSHRIIERAGLKIAIVGVVGPGQAGPCSASSTVPAVKKAVSESSSADMHIVLSHQPVHEDESIVRLIPEIDLVVNGHGRKLMSTPNVLEGGAIQLGAGTRGKKLGIAELMWASSGDGFALLGSVERLQERLKQAEERHERTRKRMDSAKSDAIRERTQAVLDRVDGQIQDLRNRIQAAESSTGEGKSTVQNRFKSLTDDVDDHPPTQAMVEAAKAQIEAAGRSVEPRQLTQSPFVGDRVCQACHSEQHAQWKSTPHSKAWATLVNAKRSQDLECFACHVTGAHHESGPQAPSEVAGLENVGCESCHGPGAEHIKVPNSTNVVRQPSESVCIQCHDGVKDDGQFDLESYMPQVEH